MRWFTHTTIVFTRYIMIALRTREEKDSRTIGLLLTGRYPICRGNLVSLELPEGISYN
ncbi:hypothetical protein [Trichococcus flocculiformis]|jgi:hypothetical protein|uniref:hypothetical protein n=1 Tax=Trichococcus flocculiformis TaxID=82803 RepID=UPI003DA33832